MSRLHIFFITLITVNSPSGLLAQHPVWHNYTTSDGLPSNETYAMMQDSRGFLWFGTKQGICRFNGYEFTRPVDTSAAASSEALYLVEDAQGRIWFNRIDGTLWLIENDSVKAWPYNELLIPFFNKPKSYRFAVDHAGAVWLSSWKRGILVVQPNGSQRIIPDQNKDTYLFSVVGGKGLCAGKRSQDAVAEFDFRKRTGQTPEIIEWKNGIALSLGLLPLNYSIGNNTGSAFSIWPLSKDTLIGCILQTYYIFQAGQLIWHGQKELNAKSVVKDRDGSILMAVYDGANSGLLRFSSLEYFKRNEFENLLPGKFVKQVLCDREGGWWAVTGHSGVYYCNNPNIRLFDDSNGLPSTSILTVCSDRHHRIFAGMPQLDIAVFESNIGRPKLLPRAPLLEMHDLHFDTIMDRLWIANYLCYLEKDRWFFPKRRIQPDLKNVGHDPEFTLSGNSIDGLSCWQSDQLTNPFYKHPARRFNLVNIKHPPSLGYRPVITLKNGGLLIGDYKGLFTYLTTADGLTTNALDEIEVSPEGVIYACSNAGLNILTCKNDGQWHIETLTKKHGLPSNQVNDVTFLGTEIWIATDGGLVRFHGKPPPGPMPAPTLEKFVINNSPSVFTPNLQLRHDQNNLSLRFFSLHFRSSGDIPYRYRLIGAADTAFTYTHTREVNFANLSAGRYTFEVQAQNEDGQWSEPAHWSFQVLPPWWATWWFRTLVAAALIAATYLFYRNRLQILQQKAADREKIQDLETAALRAQMNPHFIFNCLQAIQSFIVQNDRDSATIYLARFAKLVRLALHGSVDGRHSLASEIAMLDNYLHLEQMRFKGKFEFSIRAEGLDTEEIQLPPMLVQPFVENALIHGLQNLDSLGKLEILFQLKGEQDLEVIVKDNGPGFAEKEKGQLGNGAHKSVGMMLTQKRLEILTKGAVKAGMEEERLARETILDENGSPAGASVRFLVPVQG